MVLSKAEFQVSVLSVVFAYLEDMFSQKSLDLDEKRIAKYIYIVQELGKNFQEDNGYALSSAFCLVFPEREATSKWNAVKLHIFIYISELGREQFS